jgi:hypothetical protein
MQKHFTTKIQVNNIRITLKHICDKYPLINEIIAWGFLPRGFVNPFRIICYKR